MPGSRFLLDTNIVIALFSGEAAVTARLAQAGEVFLPSIVVGELLFGARKSLRVSENIARVNDLAAATSVLSCDLGTAHVYGEVKDELRLKGRDRVHGGGLTEGGRVHLGQADRLDFARLDGACHRRNGLLDRAGEVAPVQVPQVDVVGAQVA